MIKTKWLIRLITNQPFLVCVHIQVHTFISIKFFNFLEVAMRFTIEFIKLIMNKIILRKSIGTCMKIFCTNMGITYIKLGQILAMQNINGIFTEEDRQQ